MQTFEILMPTGGSQVSGADDPATIHIGRHEYELG